MINPAWTAAHDGPAKYPRIATQWDVPIRMSDGVVLRANVYRPADAAGRPINTPMPALLNLTPYTKLASALLDLALNVPVLSQAVINLLNAINFAGTPISGIDDLRNVITNGAASVFTTDQKLIRNGYTQIVVDVRGTGYSQGTWDVLADREQQDTIEVLDWIRGQKWANGRMGMFGASYSAINQLQAASRNPRGLQALFPVVPGGDIARDIVIPGGGIGLGFLTPWLAGVNAAKFVPDLRSLLTGTFDWKWLKSRIENPAVFVPELVSALLAPNLSQMTPTTRRLFDDTSRLRAAYRTPLDRITAATFAIGGWHDLFTNTEWRLPGALTSLPSTKKKLIMGDIHHATVTSDMGRKKGQPTRPDVLQMAWFDKWLKDVDNGIEKYSPVTVHRTGGGWALSPTFPEPGQRYQRLYLSGRRSGTAPKALSDNTLQLTPPTAPARRTIAPGLTTLCTDDTGQAAAGILIFPGCTDDNRVGELNALTFTSAPVTTTTVVSGPMNVHLNTTQDARDAYWSVTVTDVAPDGRSDLISSGQLTTSLRQIDPSLSTRAPNGDYTDPQYRLNLFERQLVRPGQAVQLDIGTHAVSALLKPGHRLRVNVYALNLIKAMTVGPVTATTLLRPQHVLIDPRQPSYLVVPSNTALR
ncbi:CocE/NonD family hydrolase [Williamsia sp. CHRR-6]|uniref:CocE/NonD family hydrolase n=1 Tax=Williamsia sp. CHRR-6 TaxID=2835871 RepID=UPI0020255D46|nr:CocE/NonD family hydrolase [Williamsia sp. CHRR-6]